AEVSPMPLGGSGTRVARAVKSHLMWRGFVSLHYLPPRQGLATSTLLITARLQAQAALWLASIKSQSRSRRRISSHGVRSDGKISTGPPTPSLDVPINPPGSSVNPSIG